MMNIFKKYFSKIIFDRDQKGMVLLLVMSFLSLAVFSAISMSTMIQRDVTLIYRVKNSEKARLIAEAGVHHALADIKANGFASKTDFTGSLDTGTYSVTYTTTGNRYLISSVGTSEGVTKTVTAEVEDTTPTSLNYFSGAGNDVLINAIVANATLVGDIHGNNNVYLKAGPVLGNLDISGDVSATGIVQEGKKYNQGSSDNWDNNVSINGAADDTAIVYEGMPRITFPTFNYEYYKSLAIDSGTYYSGDQTFNGVTFSPSNGVVFIDGAVDFHGTNVINGGIVADDIKISGGTLSQMKSGNTNFIIARDGDITVRGGRLYAEEALVFASQDIKSMQVLATFEINGLLNAKRDISIWNVVTYFFYNYVKVLPDGMLGSDGGDGFRLVSWNE